MTVIANDIKMLENKETRNFVGSIFYIVIVVFIVGFFGIKTIPPENKDFVVSLCTVLISGALLAVYQIIGKDPDEITRLRNEKKLLVQKNEELGKRITHLEQMFMDLQEKVINKLSILVDK